MASQSKIIIGLLTAIIVLLGGFVTFFVIEYRSDKEDMQNVFQPNNNVIENNQNNDNENVNQNPTNNVGGGEVAQPNANTPTNTNPTENQTTKTISREDALRIALEHAQLTQNDIRDLDIELDYEYGQNVYEVSFDYQQYEYEYYINTENGTIVKSFQELD